MTKRTVETLNREPDVDSGRVLLLNKPRGWTSFDVVARVRHILGIKKIGHTGTLDPLATGLLVLCTGRMTREIERFTGLEKEYRVRMMLGARTPSFDAESAVSVVGSLDGITEERVREALAGFTGYQTQIPPMWSAVKVKGRRLYKYARKGIEVERKPREVFIRSIVLDEYSLPEAEFTVVCSKGTYIRTLVDDAGMRLGCGAYVTMLERTRIGEFRLEDAVSIEELVPQTSVQAESMA